MSGGIAPLSDFERSAAERAMEESRAAAKAAHRGLIVTPAKPKEPPFDGSRRKFSARVDADAHLKECQKRGVLPPATIEISGTRYKVDRRFFHKRPETAADAAALQKAELKRRRKKEAALTRTAVIIGGADATR